MSDPPFLDAIADTQAHNLAWFKEVIGPGWQRVSEVLELCDVLLAALPQSAIRMAEEKAWAVSTMIHNAKRVGSTGLLSFSRGQWMEAQPLFRRYVECFGFARIAWANKEDAVTWFKGVQDDEAYAAYRKRYGRLLSRALKALDPSVLEAYDAFSKGTHSSFLSLHHTLSLGGDEKTLEIGVHYFDVNGAQNTAGYVVLFLETIRVLLLCQETFAVRTFGHHRWKPSWEYWASMRTPAVKAWLEVEAALLRRYAPPGDPSAESSKPRR
jgi:hypothetical protein